jgi:hypothetical protein
MEQQPENQLRGYKVFEPGQELPVPSKSGTIKLAGHGITFCRKLSDCFFCHDLIPGTRAFVVISTGCCVSDYYLDSWLSVTDELILSRELSLTEVLEILQGESREP